MPNSRDCKRNERVLPALRRSVALRTSPRDGYQKISILFSTPGGGRFSRAPPFVKCAEFHVQPVLLGPSSFVAVSRRPLTWPSLCPFGEQVYSALGVEPYVEPVLLALVR